MKQVTFTIKDHKDRMAIVEALTNQGYKVTVKVLTEYVPSRYVIKVRVGDNEVEE